jgi:hypothetical protein
LVELIVTRAPRRAATLERRSGIQVSATERGMRLVITDARQQSGEPGSERPALPFLQIGSQLGSRNVEVRAYLAHVLRTARA